MAAEESGNGFTRFAIRVPIQYRWNGDPHDRPAEGWTRDVSVRGARVELPALVPVGNALVVALGAGDGDSPLAAYVAWRQPGPAPYVHGLQFTGLTRTARARVGTLLDRVSPRAPRRLHCALPAMCRMHGVGMTGVPGVVRDLGIGGAGLRVPHTLPPG